jgi:hypothetical protein
LLGMLKPEGSTSMEKEQGSWSSSTTSRSFANGSRGKSPHFSSRTTRTTTIHLPCLRHISKSHPSIPLPPIYENHHQLPPQYDTTNPKSPLADHLQLAPWPSQYRAGPPPKYHGNIDHHKFLMRYKASITSAGGDEATLTKSLIISVEDATSN